MVIITAGWISLLSLVLTIGLPPIAWFAFRNWLAAWISKRVQYGFDSQIEELRAKLRTNEEQFKSDLREKEAEITTLRNNLLSGSAGRQTLLDKRRFEAVEKIWTAVNDMALLKPLSQTMAMLNFEAVSKETGNPKMRQVLEMLGAFSPDMQKLKNVARDERPFVPEIAWAYFSAFSTVLYFNLVRFQVLKVGLEDPQKYLTAENAKKILKAALPHQATFIDENDAGFYHYLLDEIEANLLRELRRILDGKEADLAATHRAKEIMSAVKEADREQATGTEVPA